MSNDHYVPQHYLRGWAHDAKKKKLFAYKLIEQMNKVVFREASIVSSSSSENLYQISDGDNYAEFETTVMTSAVDTPGSLVIAKLRDSGLGSLTVQERMQLACYIVILEGRHPDTIKKMVLGEQDIDEIFHRIESDLPLSKIAVQDVKEFTKKLQASSGALAAGLFAGWGHGTEASALLKRGWIEVERKDNQGFISSNYPVGRYMEYSNQNLILTFPVSPTRAIWFVPQNIYERYGISSKEVKAEMQLNVGKFIDIYSLGRATEAYSLIPEKDSFVEKHLGWARRTAEKDWPAYIKQAMEDGNAVHPYI